MEQGYFGAAIEADSRNIADAAGYVNPAVSPWFQAADVAAILDWRGAEPKDWCDDLASVGVSAQHETPRIVGCYLLAIGVMGQQDRGGVGIGILKRLLRIGLASPEVPHAGDLKAAIDLGGAIREEIDSSALDHPRDLARVRETSSGGRPQSTVVIPEHRKGRRLPGKTA